MGAYNIRVLVWEENAEGNKLLAEAMEFNLADQTRKDGCFTAPIRDKLNEALEGVAEGRFTHITIEPTDVVLRGGE